MIPHSHNEVYLHASLYMPDNGNVGPEGSSGHRRHSASHSSEI